MKRSGCEKFLSSTVMIAFLALGGATFAQGMGKMGGIAPHGTPPVVPNSAVSLNSPVPANGVQRDRLVSWFTKYDDIRHEAQMTPEEKDTAHKLIGAILTNNAENKAAGTALLSKLVARDKRAFGELKALRAIPETGSLQSGFMHYYDRAGDYCQQILKAMSANQPQQAVAKIQEAKRELSVLDVTNKALDKKLRKQYSMLPYRW